MRVTFPPRATSWWKQRGPAVTGQDQLAADFQTHRPYLHALAHRVLGSSADADDAVQEAWLRLARTGGADIDELRAWLTTVTGRICLDLLRRRGARLHAIAASAGRGGPAELYSQLRELVRLESELDCRLGRILASLEDRHA